MKSLLYIVAIFSLALVSCTERIPEKEMPDVDNGVITMIKATVEPLTLQGLEGVGNYAWNEAHTIGIYGTTAGQNECYLPVKTTVGDNEAYFFGNVVGGDLTIYAPYSKEGNTAARSGRVIVPAEQNYYAEPLDHFMYNSTFLATSTVGEATFGYHAGLLKIELKYDIQNITSVKVLVGNVTADGDYSNYIVGDLAVDEDVEETLTNGAASLVVKNFPEGIDSTIDNPLVVWAVVAPGEYENFVVEIANAEATTAVPVKGPFFVAPRALADKTCVAEKVNHDNTLDDFQGENGEFNPKN
jgi:hypothetical protein